MAAPGGKLRKGWFTGIQDMVDSYCQFGLLLRLLVLALQLVLTNVVIDFSLSKNSEVMYF